MKKYETLNELKRDFVSGKFTPNEPVTVKNVTYNVGYSSDHERFSDIIHEGAKGVVVFESEAGKWLMFLWGADKNTVVPYDVRETTRQTVFEDDTSDRVIADKVEVHFLNLPINGALVAKVDTGAEMCSLNAEQVKINRGQGTVSFVAPQLSQSKLTLPLADQQAVKTSGGDTTYRAVIKCSLKVKGKVLKDIMINLNDRSEMNDPMLLGQNALHAGKFLVDPNIMKEASELLSKEFLNLLRADRVTSNVALSDEKAKQIYEALEQVGDISVGDLMKLLRTQVLKNVNDISY